MVHDPSLIYRYDFGRWADKEGLAESKLSLFVRAGLPAKAEDFYPLLGFVDLYIFLMRGTLALTREERDKALLMNCQIALATFIRNVKGTPDRYDETVHYLAEMIAEGPISIRCSSSP